MPERRPAGSHLSLCLPKDKCFRETDDYSILRLPEVLKARGRSRIGGNPATMGWESQAVHLAPVRRLKELLNSPYDLPILDALKKALASTPFA